MPGFLDLSTYSEGRTLPKGRYAATFDVVLQQPTARTDGKGMTKERLVVMGHFHPITEDGSAVPGAEVFDYPLSLGTKAHLSWAPDPENGKAPVPLPDGAGQPLTAKSNWALFLKSMVDSGLPQEALETLADIDGIWIVTDNVPEPEERKSFGSATGEAEEEKRGNNVIPQVTEIMEGGKPWEGTGGVPTAPKKGAKKPAAAPAKAPAKPAAVAKPGPKPVAKAPVKKAPEPEEEATEEAGEVDEELKDAAQSAIMGVLSANPKGVSIMKLRTSVFKAFGKDMQTANAVISTFIADPDALTLVLNELGFEHDGTNVTPQ